jgi:8-oxo-dGTP pyrophosphatase MutT (NUDIX family)
MPEITESDVPLDAPLDARLAVVLLVDGAGRLLMQLRDADAPVSPNCWGLPGGHIEPGEDPDTAARREVWEETGLRLAGPLALFWHGLRPSPLVPGAVSEFFVYAAPTTATRADLTIGEGAALEFMPPSQARQLDLSDSATDIVPRFFESPMYQQMTSTTHEE